MTDSCPDIAAAMIQAQRAEWEGSARAVLGEIQTDYLSSTGLEQKLISKVRDGAKVSKKYDTAASPFHRVIGHPDTPVDLIAAPALAQGRINPAATQRRIQALANQLLTLTTSKPGARVNKRALSNEATKSPTRAS